MHCDISIVGAGIIGLTIAKYLQNHQISCTLIDPTLPDAEAKPIDYYQDTQRVVALNRASETLLRELNCWEDIPSELRPQYDAMQVWSHSNQAEFNINAQEVNQANLGYMVFNESVRTQLASALRHQGGVRTIAASVSSVVKNENGCELELDNGQLISSQLCIATDGAMSRIKQLVDVTQETKPYNQIALVTTVKTEKPHQRVARQQFGLHGTVAFLPLAQPNTSSIVWSLDNEYAKQTLSLDEHDFRKHLSASIDQRLGDIVSHTQILSFPLIARQSQHYVKNSIVFAGDSAHTIHPLAGQGVNLGLQDAKLLCELLVKQKRHQQPYNQSSILAKYQRTRKTQATDMLLAMQSIKSIYQTDNVLLNVIRGIGVSVVNSQTFLKKLIADKALGLG